MQNSSPYTFHPLQPAPLSIPSVPTTKQPLHIPDARCFLLDPILTSEECKYYIYETEKIGYETLDKEYPKEYRSNERVLVKSPALAKILWKKIEPYCQKEFLNVKPFGFGNEGLWKPIGLNEVIKFAKYKPGGKFLPHVDNMVAKSDQEKSIFTVIFYLNDDFKGGSTNFYARKDDLPFLENNSHMLEHVKPKQGACLVFNHDVIHEGEELIQGVKYIIRAEIMFHRWSQSGSVLQNASADSNFIRASQLYMLANEMERVGQLKKATELYLQALSIQTKHSTSIKKQDSKVALIDAVPVDILQHVLSYADFKTVLKASLVCQRWQYYCMENNIWKQMYLKHFGNPPEHIRSNIWYFTFRDKVRAKNGKHIVVMDMGHDTVRVGFSSCLEPVLEFPCVFKHIDHPHNFSVSKFFYGKQAYQVHVQGYFNRLASLYTPGYSSNLQYLTETIYAHLNVKMKNNPLFLCMDPNVETKYAHESLKRLASYYADQMGMAAIGSGIDYGILLHSGDRVSAVQVYKNSKPTSPPEISEMAGHFITEQVGSITKLPLHEQLEYKKNTLRVKRKHESMTSDAQVCEKLFDLANPMSIPNLIKKCVVLYPELASNIVLCGGNTLVRGFAERLQEEVIDLIEPPFKSKVQVVAHPERARFTWLGAAIVAGDDKKRKDFKKQDKHYYY
jgi:hypothetical protein